LQDQILIFGLHVMFGIEKTGKICASINESGMLFSCLIIYALTTNSPFWEGRKYWFQKHVRAKIFAKFPSGLGYLNYFDSVQSYDNLRRDTNQN